MCAHPLRGGIHRSGLRELYRSRAKPQGLVNREVGIHPDRHPSAQKPRKLRAVSKADDQLLRIAEIAVAASYLQRFAESVCSDKDEEAPAGLSSLCDFRLTAKRQAVLPKVKTPPGVVGIAVETSFVDIGHVGWSAPHPNSENLLGFTVCFVSKRANGRGLHRNQQPRVKVLVWVGRHLSRGQNQGYE